MKIFPRLITLSAVVLLAACGGTTDDSRHQEQVISGFYQQHIKSHHPGIPGEDELKQLQPFLSQALFVLLSKAADAEAKYHAATETPQPPLVDGDLFSSLFEGATALSVDSCEDNSNRSACLVHFRYIPSEGDNKGNESWHDKLLLVKENQQWRIDDIEFLGSGQSSQREYLTDTLNSIITDYH